MNCSFINDFNVVQAGATDKWYMDIRYGAADREDNLLINEDQVVLLVPLGPTSGPLQQTLSLACTLNNASAMASEHCNWMPVKCHHVLSESIGIWCSGLWFATLDHQSPACICMHISRCDNSVLPSGQSTTLD